MDGSYLPHLLLLWLFLLVPCAVRGFLAPWGPKRASRIRHLHMQRGGGGGGDPNNVDSFLVFISETSIEEVMPADLLGEILGELQSEDSFIKKNKGRFTKVWDEVETRVREEKKTIRELVGDINTNRLLDIVERSDIYDPAAVKAFLDSPPILKMMSNILYEAIFEFIQRVDILGNIVNNLPIIGPIRVQIMKELKTQLDRTLGNQVQSFLSNFNKVAVTRMIEFVLSDENREQFSKANRKLVDSIISRSIGDLLASEASTQKLRENVFEFLTTSNEEETKAAVDEVYTFLGHRKLGDVVDVHEVVSQTPSMRRALARLLDQYEASKQSENEKERDTERDGVSE